MPASSFAKDFTLKTGDAIRRFDAYEAEKGATINRPDRDPLEDGRKILAQIKARIKQSSTEE